MMLEAISTAPLFHDKKVLDLAREFGVMSPPPHEAAFPR
jgi:hypothetical protein